MTGNRISRIDTHSPVVPPGYRNWLLQRGDSSAPSTSFCGDDPGHFGFFATLALPDIDGSVAETEYAFVELHADGVVLMINTDNIYFGSAERDPLLEYLDERAAVVFVHPAAPVGPLACPR